MKTPFVTTQLTLLMKLAERESGESEIAWSRFFELYYPAMVKYASLFCNETEAEDIAQNILIKLVDILRNKRYKRRQVGSFRAYLKMLIRNEFIDFHRAELSRGRGRTVPIETLELAHMSDPAMRMDAEWKVAIRAVATEHVLTKTVMSELMREAYRLYVLEGMSVKDVSKRLGVTQKYVSLAKSRINRRIAAVEAVYGEE